MEKDVLVTMTWEIAADRKQDVDKEVPPDAESHRHRDGRSDDSHQPDHDIEEVVALGLRREDEREG